MENESSLWRVRCFIYKYFADTTRAPSIAETGRHFNITSEEAGEIYTELNNRHMLFLEPDSLTIRIAAPFSGIPTDFKVHANGKTYYANCAWDMLGIPAALHCDAVIDTVFTESKEAVQLEIRDGQIHVTGTRRNLLVHFPLPCARWYDDLVFT